jgi:F-type H+-transporting ATPase subunit gamma
MPSTRDIRRRIKSVKNTAQITKAMQMVASAKMRKAQQAALAGRPYAALMNKVLAHAASGAGDFNHPLMEQRPVAKRAVVLISTDKGLCGALNTNLLREAMKLDKDNTVFICVGRKGSQWASRLKRQIVAEFTYKDNPQFSEARAISKFVQELFTKGEVDEVQVLYNNFISTLAQKPETHLMLPLQEISGVQASPDGHREKVLLEATGHEYIFEPSAAEVLGELLPRAMNFEIYQFLLEARASEHSSRMVAMKNATDNAKQLIKSLTLEYNKLRQANITKELLEITTAQMAMG